VAFLDPLISGVNGPGTRRSNGSGGRVRPVRAPAVAIVRWPQDAAVLAGLRRQGCPRLLLVDPDAEAPVVTDLLEDWVRLPAGEQDIQTRVESLCSRLEYRQVPVFDGVCRIGFRDGWAPLSPTEYCLASVLVERFGFLVTDKDLSDRAWADAPRPSTALRVHLTRLRRRVEPIGLEILTIRSRGHIMQEVGTTRPTAGSWPALER
jgi:two-component system OmpR family response regulator